MSVSFDKAVKLAYHVLEGLDSPTDVNEVDEYDSLFTLVSRWRKQVAESPEDVASFDVFAGLVLNSCSQEQLAEGVRDRACYDGVRRIAARMLREGEEWSEPLTAFVADVLEGKPPPTGVKGPDLKSTFTIGVAVASAARVIGRTYRRDNSRNPDSACDAVVEALRRLGVTLTYRQVGYRYQEHQKLERRQGFSMVCVDVDDL